MPEINKAVIEERAKKLSKQDGWEWEPEFKMLLPKYSKIVPKPVLLDEEARQKYLERARKELLNERGGCAQS
jgi:hypothetical protein